MTRTTTTFAGIVSAVALIASIAGAATAPPPLSAGGTQVVHLTLAAAIARLLAAVKGRGVTTALDMALPDPSGPAGRAGCRQGPGARAYGVVWSV